MSRIPPHGDLDAALEADEDASQCGIFGHEWGPDDEASECEVCGKPAED